MNTRSVRIPFFLGMVLLTIFSIWTTYMSVTESIMPPPEGMPAIPLGNGVMWQCSPFALMLAVAIGLMLLSLKLAIIGGQKRMSFRGVIGLTIVAFISITFNMDVLYRIADKGFFLRYSATRVTSVYNDYLLDTQAALNERRLELERTVAEQEGELEAEIRGLREDPEGYGPKAKKEDYKLLKLQRVAEVDLEELEQAYAAKDEAETLLATFDPKSLEDIDALQNKLRVAVTDIGAVTKKPLPEPVRLDRPLFAVFRNLFDLKKIGMMEVFFLVLALFLDLGDIIGYSLVPQVATKEKHVPVKSDPDPETDDVFRRFDGPELLPEPAPEFIESSADDFFNAYEDEDGDDASEAQSGGRSFRMRR